MSAVPVKLHILNEKGPDISQSLLKKIRTFKLPYNSLINIVGKREFKSPSGIE